MAEEIAYMSAVNLLEQYRTKRLSPVEATRAVLDRIATYNNKLNVFCFIDEEGSIATAKESETRWLRGEPLGLMDGVPTTIKDLLLSRGWPTLRGSRTVDPHQPWTEDTPAVARLRAHGAIFLGKTTTPEFGWKGVTDSPLTGITRNPWNLELTPGGSSGGASVAAAAGMGQLHLGTDGGGSIRIPSSFCGVFGLKSSYGRVPRYPASSYDRLGCVGPITRTVSDAALMLTAMAGEDVMDWHSLPSENRDYRAGLDTGVKGLRIAFSPTLGYADVEPEVATLVAKEAKTFAHLGADVEEVDPGFEDPIRIFRTHWHVGSWNMVHLLKPEQLALLDLGLVKMAEEGRQTPLINYLTAGKEREILGQHMKRFHLKYDLLLTPAVAVSPFKVGQITPWGDDTEWFAWTPFTFPFNLTQQPAASIPCGLTSKKLPVGLQIVAPMFRDDLVLRAARAYELASSMKDCCPIL